MCVTETMMWTLVLTFIVVFSSFTSPRFVMKMAPSVPYYLFSVFFSSSPNILFGRIHLNRMMPFPRRFLLSTVLALYTSARPATAFQPWSRRNHHCLSRRLAAINGQAVAKKETVNGQNQKPPLAIGDTFTSNPMPVFIEDTDTYGVVYNGNYLRFYDRALSSLSCYCTDRHVMTAVGNQKFRSSPALGDEYVIEGTLQDVSDHRAVWNLVMKSVGGTVMYHSADGVVVAPTDRPEWLDVVNPFDTASHLPGSTGSFVAYRDEFDPSMRSHLPLTSVLNHLERPRTNVFGGPKELRRLQEEDGIVVVVTGIRDLCLLPHATESLIGGVVTVETVYDMRKGGMRFDLFQTMYTSAGERLAQGIVTLYTLNKETFRPTSKLPQRLLDRLRGGQQDE